MDARLMAVIDRLSEDLANLEKALAGTQELLRALAKEARRTAKPNGRERRRLDAAQFFLANQQPRWSGTAPWRARQEDDGSD